MFTLFMAISGGISWEVSIKPLREISELAVACMVLYIVIAVFAILNVVTGVFCNTAIESAQADRDIAIMKYMAKHKAQVEALQIIFAEIDRDESDLVSIDELKAAMAEKKLASFMESLDISTQDVWSLFLIIDADESGTITLDEFVSGCMQLHGTAKSFQLAKMSYENKVTRQEIKHLSVQVSQLVRHFQLDLTQRSSSSTPWSSAGFGSVIHCTPEPGKNLGKCIREALKSNLVPFLVAEESCMCHALEALLAADVMTEPAAQCVSMRLAALERRRQRDYKRFFRTALQSSILSGSCIALVFEDDTPVELGEDEWLQRTPSNSAMEALPDEWSLSCFFNSSALPPEIFAPMTFNTRGKAPLLLPNGSDNGVLPLQSEPAEATPAPSQDLMFRAAGELPESGAGSTGHLFQATEEEMKSRDPKDTTSFLGLPLHYQVHPVVLAQGRMPDAMEDSEVRKWVKQRFGKHAPMHRLAVVVLTAPQEEEAA
eukprot:symbB.v1.2.009187.t1/scaffold581.1/size274127/1